MTQLGDAINRDKLTQYQTVVALRATIRDRNALMLALTSEKIGLDQAEAEELIDRATGELIEAANYVQEEELGRATARLHQICVKSESIQDYKACLAIQKELNKLLGLYPDAPRATAPAPAPSTTEEVSREPANPLAGLRLVANE